MGGPQTDDSEIARAGRSDTPTPRRSWSRPRRRRAQFGALGLAALGVTGGLLAASALAAPTPAPPSVGLKVLLIGSGSADPTTVAWEAALSSEGVPYTEVTATNTGALGSWQVALPALTNGTQGNYNGVVIADSPTDFAAAQARRPRHLRGPVQRPPARRLRHRLPVRAAELGVANDPTGLAVTATSESLTPAGTTALPGLAGSVPFDTGSYAYPATVTSPAFTSWLSFGGATSLGRSTRPREPTPKRTSRKPALFFAYNQYQAQWHVLSRGLIDWVTNNTHLGLFHDVSLHLDDMFNSDNTWDITTHTTSLTAAAQMSPADVVSAAQWSRLNNFRIDWALNGGASTANATPAVADPLLAQYQTIDPATGKPYADDFGWMNHTWDHATLDQGCATSNYIQAELNQNTAFATANAGSGGLGGLGLTPDPNGTSNGYGTFDQHAFIPGEHAALANLIPGVTASIDAVSATAAAGGSGGTLPAGTYNYAVTAQYIYNTGDSQSVTSSVTVGAGQTVSLNWTGTCKAASYRVYRQAPGSATWTYVTTLNPPNPATLDPTTTASVAGGGMAPVSYTDTGAARTSTAFVPSLTVTTALEFPYEQNQVFNQAMTGRGHHRSRRGRLKALPEPAQHRLWHQHDHALHRRHDPGRGVVSHPRARARRPATPDQRLLQHRNLGAADRRVQHDLPRHRLHRGQHHQSGRVGDVQHDYQQRLRPVLCTPDEPGRRVIE